jgi:hypothetical protein
VQDKDLGLIKTKTLSNSLLFNLRIRQREKEGLRRHFLTCMGS